MAPSATSGSSQPPGRPPDPSSHAGAQVGLVAALPASRGAASLPEAPPTPGRLLVGSDPTALVERRIIIWRRGSRNTHFNLDLVIHFVCFLLPRANVCPAKTDCCCLR